jgi:predicted nucleic acid-binding protein
MIYAVFDTNVLVSALITHNVNASTVKVVEAIGDGKVIPLYNDEIVAEYDEVLSREKFGLLKNRVKRLDRSPEKQGYQLGTCRQRRSLPRCLRRGVL